MFINRLICQSHDVKNYGDRRERYPLRPKAKSCFVNNETIVYLEHKFFFKKESTFPQTYAKFTTPLAQNN